MPFRSPDAQMKRIGRGMMSLAQSNGSARQTIMRGVKQQVALVLKAQFQTSTDPDGSTWQPKKSGKPALVSKKLPQAFELKATGESVAGIGKVRRDWLEAHQTGHVFKSRAVADKANVMFFNARGVLVKRSRGEKMKRGRAVFARGHRIGQRVLPARPMIPRGNGELPLRWAAAAKAGVVVGMGWWAEKLQR